MNLVDVLSWIRQHKTSAFGIVLVVAGCIALVSLSHRVHHLKPRASTAGAAVATTPGAAIAGGGALAPSVQAGTEQNPRSARMRSEFEGAASYVEFIQQAMGRPQEGGKFYALLAWQRCNDLQQHKAVAATHTGDDAFHDGAVALIDDIGKRCSGVQDTWPDIGNLYDIVMMQRAGRDFLLPEKGRGIVAPATRQTAAADIDAALRTADRWAQAEALLDNADFLDVGDSAGDDGLDRQLHEWSAEVVACELVASCRGGIQVTLHCVNTGDCAHDDYRDVIRAQVPETHRAVFDTMVDGLHLRMGLAATKADDAASR